MDGTTPADRITDLEFAQRFERGEIRNEDFHHREHLRVAWAFLQQSETTDEACDRMRNAIRAFALRAGHARKYHETLTVFWVRLLAEVRKHVDDAQELEAILPAHRFLLDKDAPLAWYTRARLYSDDARLNWSAPDLRTLGSHAPHAHSGDPSGDAQDRPVHHAPS
jgi:hypothetical protein